MAQDNYGQYGDWRDRDRGQSMGERRYGREDRSRMGRMGRAPEDRSFNEPRYGRDQEPGHGGYRADRDYQARDYQGYGEDAYERSRGSGEDDWRYRSRATSGRYGQGPSEAWGQDRSRGYGQAYGEDDRWRAGGWQDRDYGRRGEQDRSAAERTRERLGEWFGADRDRGEGQHRGRGPRGYRRSDERIREDVNDRLTDDPFLDASNIEVQVKDCEVILAGIVNSREDKRRAEMLAERCSGVDNVQNNLRVENRYGQNQPSTMGQSGMSRSDTVGGTTNPSVMDVAGGGTGHSGRA